MAVRRLWTACALVLCGWCMVLSRAILRVTPSRQTAKIQGHKPMFRLQSTAEPSHQDMHWDPKAAPKLDFNEDFYSVLEVDPTITPSELKKAYYKIVFKYHPDNVENEGNKDLCNKQMMVINGAYRILKNPALRTLYDKQRNRGLYGVKAGVTERTAAGAAADDHDDDERDAAAAPRKQSAGGGTSAGFGGAWGGRGADTDAAPGSRTGARQADRSHEQQPQQQQEREETAYQRAERIRRERDREWEEAGWTPQPQRQRVDGYSEGGYGGSGGSAWASPSASRYGRADEPRRPDSDSAFGDSSSSTLDDVEKFLRSTGSQVSNEAASRVAAMRAKLDTLKARKSDRERAVYADNRDWGEVTDMRLIQRRLEDINELKVLTQQVADLEEEIADALLRGRTTTGGGAVGGGYRPPAVDLWGDSADEPRRYRSSSSSSSGGSSGSGGGGYKPPPRRRSLDSDDWDSYFNDGDSFGGYGGGGAGPSKPPGDEVERNLWRRRRGGGGGRAMGGAGSIGAMGSMDVGAVNVNGGDDGGDIGGGGGGGGGPTHVGAGSEGRPDAGRGPLGTPVAHEEEGREGPADDRAQEQQEEKEDADVDAVGWAELSRLHRRAMRGWGLDTRPRGEPDGPAAAAAAVASSA